MQRYEIFLEPCNTKYYFFKKKYLYIKTPRTQSCIRGVITMKIAFQ